MTSTPLAVLGGLTAEQFLNDYWQKKPLLVRNAMPQLAGLFEPQDILELALEDGVTARLLTQNSKQHGKQHDQWQLKNSPLSKKDFKKLPELWTLLVQAVDHWSPDLAELWQQFEFIPQWRRDDIMLSYAPKGGSVGRHFDQYDVFLVQAHGARRWQLGQCFDPQTNFLPNQPLRLLPDMGELIFDDVLQVGDLLYVPPSLSHYGVAQNDCLTASFGFRMPNSAALVERMADQVLSQSAANLPLPDRAAQSSAGQAGLVSAAALHNLREQLLATLHDPATFNHAVMGLLSEQKFAEHSPEIEALDANEWQDALADGVSARLDPSTRLLYTVGANNDLTFWFNGELLKLNDAISQQLAQQLADGRTLQPSQLQQLPVDTALDWIEKGLLLIQFADDE